MDITIGAHDYRIDKLNAFKQFHVARRLAPALWALGAGAMASLKHDNPENVDMIATVTSAAGPLIDVISTMSDIDSQYVLDNCLSVCFRKDATSGGYQRIFVEKGGILFDDIDMSVMMQLVLAAIRENLGNFLSALPS